MTVKPEGKRLDSPDALSDVLPVDVQEMIGKSLYEEEAEFPIEIGYVYNTCAAVANGNPIFWDEEAANEITGGRIAPPTMLSVWFRPHYWSPGATSERTALQSHFDLKRLLDLPEAIVSSNETAFGEPVRMGDKLRTKQIVRSISELKDTKLGRGRFWTIDVESFNQYDEWVGTDTYVFLGYRSR